MPGPVPPAELRNRFADYRWDVVGHGHSAAMTWRLISGQTPVRDLFLKLVGPTGSAAANELAAAAARADWLHSTGFPTAPVVEFETSDEASWLITTAVPGRPGSDPWPEAERAAVIDAFAEITRALHALPVQSCPFDGPTASASDARLVVGHGDLCLPNVLIDPDRLVATGLIDLSQLGRADPAQDVGDAVRSISNARLNPQFGPAYARQFVTALGSTGSPGSR